MARMEGRKKHTNDENQLDGCCTNNCDMTKNIYTMMLNIHIILLIIFNS